MYIYICIYSIIYTSSITIIVWCPRGHGFGYTLRKLFNNKQKLSNKNVIIFASSIKKTKTYFCLLSRVQAYKPCDACSLVVAFIDPHISDSFWFFPIVGLVVWILPRIITLIVRLKSFLWKSIGILTRILENIKKECRVVSRRVDRENIGKNTALYRLEWRRARRLIGATFACSFSFQISSLISVKRNRKGYRFSFDKTFEEAERFWNVQIRGENRRIKESFPLAKIQLNVTL